MREKYDLKVGYSCNNHCFHCVIRPNVWNLEKNNCEDKKDSNYNEIIKCINSESFKNASTVVITGGEPTIRKEFMRILNYINKKYPGKEICLQTNGRELGKYVKDIYQKNINISYVVALHGYEELHNDITGNNYGNPFKETWQSILDLQQVYREKLKMRIEIVLSRKNLYQTPGFIEYLYQHNIKNIGISYPHLDGFANYSLDYAKEIGFPYSELKKTIPQYYELAYKYPDLQLYFEEVPRCMWRNNVEKLLDLPPNIGSMTHQPNEKVAVKFPESNLNDDFRTAYIRSHRQSSLCRDCFYCCSCLGVWEEAIRMFGDTGFVPVKEREIKEVYAGVSC